MDNQQRSIAPLLLSGHGPRQQVILEPNSPRFEDDTGK
jgi:hypothetical protein